jgi:undecaprenyl-diphosphatase
VARGFDATGRPTRYLNTLSRHPGDAVRLVVALLLLGLTAIPVDRSDVPILEEDAFWLLNDLPAALFPVIWLPMQAGSVGAVGLFTGLALLARRRLLAVELAVAGTLAWGLAKLVKLFFERPRPGVLFPEATLHGDVVTGLGYLSGHAAIAATLATVAGPWLPRRLRRAAWALALLVGASRIYVGAHLPLDVLGGYALGWAIGACVHLLLGAPGGRPGTEVTARALSEIGLAPREVVPVGAGAFTCTTEAGDRYHVRVVGPDHRDADVVHRSWRRMVSRWFREKPPFGSPRQRLDHEAAASLLARATGARVPSVTAVRTFGTGLGILVTEHVEGEPLDRSPVDEELLAAVWRQVGLLHAGRIAHGDLHASKVLVDEVRRPWLVDFALAESGAEPARLHQDVAELLASLEPLVGAPAAVAAAGQALGGAEALEPVARLLHHARRAGESESVRSAREALLRALPQPAPSTG